MVTTFSLLSIPFVYMCLRGRATLLAVRWEQLFDDLEGQVAASERVDLDAEVADRTRIEVARLSLGDRLRAAVGTRIELSLGAAGAVTGELTRTGPGWLLLDGGRGMQVVVTEAAISAGDVLPAVADAPGSIGLVESRLDLGHVLRAIARDRVAVRVVLCDGSSRVGTIDRVGADFIDLAEHPADQPRRPSEVTRRSAIRLAAIAMVRAG